MTFLLTLESVPGPRTPPHLQLLFVKVAKPLQRNHLIEAVQEGFGLLLHPTGEPPVCQQAVGRRSGWFNGLVCISDNISLL